MVSDWSEWYLGHLLAWLPVEIPVWLAIGAGMAGSSSFSLGGPSVTSLGGGAPKAADGSSLFGMLCWETGVEMVGEAHCSHYKASWSCWLMAVAMSWEGSTLVAREGGTTGVVVGAWMVVVTLMGWILLRSNSIRGGSWADHLWQQLSRVVALERWTTEPQAPHLALLGIPPNPHVAVIFILATDGANCRHLCWAHHLS